MDSYFPDVLRFPDDNEVMDTSFAGSSATNGSYFPQGVFQDANADLNDFFPRTGLTPLGTPGIGLFGGSQPLPGHSWDSQQQMLNAATDSMLQNVPPLQTRPETTVNPNVVDGTAAGNSAVKQQSSDDSKQASNGNETVEVQKPKRGRPRKKRDKKQLTPEEENAKRQRFLERNRLAASKCRDRKKNWTQETMDKLSREERKHVELQLEYNRLHGEVASLMETACEHLGHCSHKDTSFQDSLSLLSDRIADIGRMYLSMGGLRGREEVDTDEESSTTKSDEPPHKRARHESERRFSTGDSAQIGEGSGDSTMTWANSQTHPKVEEEDTEITRAGRMSRQGSSNSAGSGSDRDSAISMGGSPVKSKFQLPAEEDFFDCDDDKSMFPMTQDPCLIPQDAQAKLDALLFSRNVGMNGNMESSDVAS